MIVVWLLPPPDGGGTKMSDIGGTELNEGGSGRGGTAVIGGISGQLGGNAVGGYG